MRLVLTNSSSSRPVPRYSDVTTILLLALRASDYTACHAVKEIASYSHVEISITVPAYSKRVVELLRLSQYPHAAARDRDGPGVPAQPAEPLSHC